MKYDIKSKLSDQFLETKIELLEYLINQAKQGKSNKSFTQDIDNYLSEKEHFPYMTSYCMVGPKYGLGCLLGHFLYHYINEPDFTKQVFLLTDLLEYIQAFRPSKNALLKQTTTVKLIGLIEDFGIFSAFFRNSDHRPLRIHYIPYDRADSNGHYYPNLNIIALYKYKENSYPEYVFIHEIAHLITHNLTGSPHKVPDSFNEFNKTFHPTWKPRSTDDIIEIFVDLFSIAIMAETEFASRNPLIDRFSDHGLKMIKDYFITLTRKLKYAKQSPILSRLAQKPPGTS
ncbi:MAG: hypothetical protein JST68_27840 [Bacteroidetes bacterium]|nr:hypothetical protein [Bacteroidota bacterium]